MVSTFDEMPTFSSGADQPELQMILSVSYLYALKYKKVTKSLQCRTDTTIDIFLRFESVCSIDAHGNRKVAKFIRNFWLYRYKRMRGFDLARHSECPMGASGQRHRVVGSVGQQKVSCRGLHRCQFGSFEHHRFRNQAHAAIYQHREMKMRSCRKTGIA